MWKSQLGTATANLQAKTDDDWDTDPDFVVGEEVHY